MIWLFAAALAVAASDGGSRGREIFHKTALPACIACHNAGAGSLERSQLTPKDVEDWIRNGREGKMPAYRFEDDDLRALIEYVVSLRKKK